jgi:lysozyme
MKTSAAGRALIEALEGFRGVAYLPTPQDVPTIGYGHTRGVQMGDTCTPATADYWLSQDLAGAEGAVIAYVTYAQLNQNQFDALVSFTYNVGTSAFGHSTLLELLNEGDLVGAANQFLVWNKQAGNVLEGLTARRMKERELFLTPGGDVI